MNREEITCYHEKQFKHTFKTDDLFLENDFKFLEDPKCRNVIDRCKLKRQKDLFTSKKDMRKPSVSSLSSSSSGMNLILLNRFQNSYDIEIQSHNNPMIFKPLESNPITSIPSSLFNRNIQNNYNDVFNAPKSVNFAHPRFNEVIETYITIPKSLVLQNSTIQMILKHDIRIDLATDQSICVFNSNCNIQIALSTLNGGSVALIHPNGRLYQIGHQVDIMAFDGMNKNNFIRYAKIWHEGISFTEESCSYIYLVDTIGTRTTTDKIMDLSKDIISMVFFKRNSHGYNNVAESFSILQNSNVWMTSDKIECIDINDYRITQSVDGLVKITKNNDNCLIRTSPNNGSVTITTPLIHCTASLGQTSHLFVRRGDRRMHFDGSSFTVRNAGHSAGFDDKNLLRVY